MWNVESGALRRRFMPAGHTERPPNERPVECVAFMSGRLRHVFVTVRVRGWAACSAVLGTCVFSLVPLSASVSLEIRPSSWTCRCVA